MNQTLVSTFYKFMPLLDVRAKKDSLQSFCVEHTMKGTILLSKEGFNGTVAGTEKGIDAMHDYLCREFFLTDLEYKKSYVDFMPFNRMKVRLKKEIVTMGVSGINPQNKGGMYVKPEEWNDLIKDPDVFFLDVRNEYEIDIGTFENAKSPTTRSFREWPGYVHQQLEPQKHKKIAMFCTGGIRYEKASAFLRKEGFEHVFQLQGGILKYLEKVPEEKSCWEGECFVFDNRVSVDHRLEKGSYELCHPCRHPVDSEHMVSSKHQLGVSCPHCFDSLTEDKRSRMESRQLQMELAKKRNTVHIGQRSPS
ncbi:MAG: rhodanese-related sulfurtransferase [Kiritimatiellae bacterium]|nr:rhodanese-related sulfurtransferase [Kiritimatiellia bacterium]